MVCECVQNIIRSYISVVGREGLPPVTSMQMITHRNFVIGEFPSWWNLFVRFPETRVTKGDHIKVDFEACYEEGQPLYSAVVTVTARNGTVVMGPEAIQW
uniref:Uncharacterized protein n=1 Tax=Lotharella globosa TaxID=91324 RepID=A0A7S4DNY4_9EUKA